jgi:multiple sugar transport system permease protein
MGLPAIETSIKKITVSIDVVKKRKTRFEKKISLFGLIFALPWIVGLLLFHAYPLFMSAYYSLTSYSILEPGNS